MRHEGIAFHRAAVDLLAGDYEVPGDGTLDTDSLPRDLSTIHYVRPIAEKYNWDSFYLIVPPLFVATIFFFKFFMARSQVLRCSFVDMFLPSNQTSRLLLCLLTVILV